MESPSRDQAIEALYQRAGVLIREFSDSMPPYRTIPRSLVASAFERGTKLNIELFFEYLRHGRMPAPEETRELVELALDRVRDGEPLDEVLGRYRQGAEFIYTRLRAAAQPGERDLLADAALPLLQYVTQIVERIATACVRRAHDPRWELLERRRGIADALLTGRDPVEWADEPAITVPDAFLIAVFRLSTNTRERQGLDTSELRHCIEAIPGVFLRLDSGGWTALVPLQPGDDGTATSHALSSRLPARNPDAAPPFWVGIGAARTRADIPAVFAEARVLAELGRCLDRTELVCRRKDLQFEYTVAASGPARPGLATVLAPLDSQPLLAETLEVFVDTGFNQLATARLLNIHRNTVTYRLARVHELTGLDPHRPTDAMTLSAARIARRLESASFAP
ncbi:PucR family transcriptional regulator [Nocardia pseudobrasiliensis]|uniref:PucR-like helix-turn-helix protein n=1 Tax=Nocardia pseudobrasiliensis TaxID=45979 RepID=A0A370IAI1_9NOCA|nr:helix-turn-helix domain-containing protein [Nocardia pseudobrasiliensis]RDI67131.1 PucR-like helix-turn-helix protein [Nocardia pseudobrasiliensis]